jgi:hypothetical protein
MFPVSSSKTGIAQSSKKSRGYCLRAALCGVTFVTRLANCERVRRDIGSSSVGSTTGCWTDTGLVNSVILDLVRSDIGLDSGCGCLTGDRGDTLVPWSGTLGGDALGVGSGEAIGK